MYEEDAGMDARHAAGDRRAGNKEGFKNRQSKTGANALMVRHAPTQPEASRMTAEIRDCLPPDRNPRKPNIVLPGGSIDTHVHVFEPGYALSPGRGYNPPYSTLADLKHLHATLGIDRVVFTQPSVYGTDNSAILTAM